MLDTLSMFISLLLLFLLSPSLFLFLFMLHCVPNSFHSSRRKRYYSSAGPISICRLSIRSGGILYHGPMFTRYQWVDGNTNVNIFYFSILIRSLSQYNLSQFSPSAKTLYLFSPFSGTLCLNSLYLPCCPRHSTSTRSMGWYNYSWNNTYYWFW